MDKSFADYLLSKVFGIRLEFEPIKDDAVGVVSLIFKEQNFAYAALSYFRFYLKNISDTQLTIILKPKSTILISLNDKKLKPLVQVETSLYDTLKAIQFVNGNVPYGSMVGICFEYFISNNSPKKEKAAEYDNGDGMPKQFINTKLYRCDNDGYEMPL